MSEWNRRRVVVIDEFIGFPKDIATIVAGYCAELQLLPWIDKEKLDRCWLYSNPKAVEVGWLDLHGGDPFWIAANSAAGDVIKANIAKYSDESNIWENPTVFDLLIERGCEIDPTWFCSNPHPKAVAMVISGKVEMNVYDFNKNPGAINWLRTNSNMINNEAICANPEAIDIIQSLKKIDYNQLSANHHPWAIEQLSRVNADQINWATISANPGIFEYHTDPAWIATLTRA